MYREGGLLFGSQSARCIHDAHVHSACRMIILCNLYDYAIDTLCTLYCAIMYS